MIEAKLFVDSLAEQGINFYTGVPDSLLKDFCAYVEANGGKEKHLITANEGNAVALAAGYYMASRHYAAVYLQNSGLGNIINPITSLADKEVYSIPMLLIIGWRGEPDVKDEPQHIKQGRITPAQLELLDIPYRVVSSETDVAALALWAKQQLDSSQAPVALLIKKGAFAPYKNKPQPQTTWSLGREEALDTLLPLLGHACVVATTGKTSREVFELREKHQQPQQDFLTVGGMGHTLSIALGVAMGQPNKQVVCLDGDGSALMHLGAMPITGAVAPQNLIHVLLNNAAHESVGGQPTVAHQVDFQAIAFASGYQAYAVAESKTELIEKWQHIRQQAGPILFEIRIAAGSRDDLGRPTSTPIQNKNAFMKWVQA